MLTHMPRHTLEHFTHYACELLHAITDSESSSMYLFAHDTKVQLNRSNPFYWPVVWYKWSPVLAAFQQHLCWHTWQCFNQ